MANENTIPQKPHQASEGTVIGLRENSHLFEAAGLTTFNDWMSLEGYRYREVSMRPKRPVVAIEVPGISREIFLKRHWEPPRPDSLAQRLGISKPPSEAHKEVDQLAKFSRAGIRVPEVVAWGEGDFGGIRNASFIATLDLEALPLERYLFHHWKRPVPLLRSRDKRAIVEALGRLASRMHSAGLVHRDFYLGHIFVSAEGESPDERLSVIDVQRASVRPQWWLRSQIKDLASLHFSADPAFIRDVDRVRFLKSYWDTAHFTAYHRWIIRAVLRKAYRIRKHTEKALGLPYSEYFKNKYY